MKYKISWKIFVVSGFVKTCDELVNSEEVILGLHLLEPYLNSTTTNPTDQETDESAKDNNDTSSNSTTNSSGISLSFSWDQCILS